MGMGESSITLVNGYRVVTQQPYEGLVSTLVPLYKKSVVVLQDNENKVFYLWRGKNVGVLKKRKADKIVAQFRDETAAADLREWEIVVVEEGEESAQFNNVAVKSMEPLLERYQQINQGFVVNTLLHEAVYRELLFKQWDKEEYITEGLTRPMDVAESGLRNAAPYNEQQIQMLKERAVAGFLDGHALIPLVFAELLRETPDIGLDDVPAYGPNPSGAFFYKTRLRALGFTRPYKPHPINGLAIKYACDIAANGIKAKLRPSEEIRYGEYGIVSIGGASIRFGPIVVTTERIMAFGNYPVLDYNEYNWIHYDESQDKQLLGGMDFFDLSSISEFKIEGKKEKKIKLKYYCEYSNKIPIMGSGLLFIALKPKWTRTKKKDLSVTIDLIPQLLDPASGKKKIDLDDLASRCSKFETIITELSK